MLKDLSYLLSLTDIGIAFQVRGLLYFIDCLGNSIRRNRGNSFDWLLVSCVFSLIGLLSNDPLKIIANLLCKYLYMKLAVSSSAN